MNAYFKNQQIVGAQGPAYTPGNGVEITQGEAGPVIGVTTPVQGIVTQAEFDALSEAERNKGLYLISDGDDGGGSVGSGVPSGFIGLWSGAADNIPTGWALCDGQDGRPDLRGKFVLGAGPNHAVGETGGSETVTLTVDQMPAHAHEFAYGSLKLQQGTINSPLVGASGYGVATTMGAGSKNPDAISTMPPYYALCYIMKL